MIWRALRIRAKVNDRGAALVTVLLASFLLLTASIALLSALGRNSANSTDVLSETKAYYAAESGLQAAINKLRYDCSATYSAVKADPDMSSWLNYNVTTSDGVTTGVVIGQAATDYVPRTGSAFRIAASDPDNIGSSTTFSTIGGFAPTTLTTGPTPVPTPIQGTLSPDGTSVTYGTSPNRTTVTMVGQSPPTVDFSNYQNPPLIGFNVQNEVGGTGSPITDVLRFEIRYQMSFPRAEDKTIYGTLTQNSATGAISANFLTREYTLMGSYINVCGNSGCVVPMNPCAPRPVPQVYSVPITAANATTVIWANITPVQPTRMLVRSTGYGPQRSKKILEAIIERNFFDNLGSSPAISMIGPSGSGFVFQPGTSSGVTYSGGGSPSFGVTDPSNLNYLLTHPPGPSGGSLTQMQPPPALITDLPSWQACAAALNAKVQEYRLAAQGSGTYYSGGGSLPFAPGNTNGTGITFCEGNCKVTADGGGILVVTGQLTNVGDFDFTGLIIVTGAGGWLRNGGGNGVIKGSIVVAPYDPNNLGPLPCDPTNSYFLPPKYQVTGGGSSDVIFTELSTAFDGTGAATDFVQGVAEK